MSISSAHAAAARQNGKLSNGPATAEGKARSSRNACKHGIFGSTKFLSDEHQSRFAEIEKMFTAEFNPKTPIEFHYVHEIADARFRLDMIREYAITLQENLMAAELDEAKAFESLADSPALGLIQRYERQFERRIDNAFTMLRKIQTQRQAELSYETNARKTRLQQALQNDPKPQQPAAQKSTNPAPPKPNSAESSLLKWFRQAM